MEISLQWSTTHWYYLRTSTNSYLRAFPKQPISKLCWSTGQRLLHVQPHCHKTKNLNITYPLPCFHASTTRKSPCKSTRVARATGSSPPASPMEICTSDKSECNGRGICYFATRQTKYVEPGASFRTLSRGLLIWLYCLLEAPKRYILHLIVAHGYRAYLLHSGALNLPQNEANVCGNCGQQ